MLTGVSELASFATGLRLITSTGWDLGGAELLDDSATLTTVRAGELQPTVARVDAKRGGKSTWIASLGWIELSLEQLSKWRAGDTIDFAKQGAGSADLHGPTQSLNCELVRVGEEVGLRVLA